MNLLIKVTRGTKVAETRGGKRKKKTTGKKKKKKAWDRARKGEVDLHKT